MCDGVGGLGRISARPGPARSSRTERRCRADLEHDVAGLTEEPGVEGACEDLGKLLVPGNGDVVDFAQHSGGDIGSQMLVAGVEEKVVANARAATLAAAARLDQIARSRRR